MPYRRHGDVGITKSLMEANEALMSFRIAIVG